MASGTSPATLAVRWERLGGGDQVVVNSVELRRVELPFRVPVTTAKAVHRSRPLLLVRVVGRTVGTRAAGAAGAGTAVEGWGECASLADTAFDTEDVGRSWAVLEHALVPALLDVGARSGHRLPRPCELGTVREAAPDAPLAFAALEMAVADAHLRSEDRSLAGLLGVEGRTVELGAVIGVADSVDRLLTAVAGLVDRGFSRVKLKIGPGWDIVPVAAVAQAFPGLRLQVDANGAYGLQDADLLAGLDRFGLLCFEQPLGRDDLAGHAVLATRMTTPICLDEDLDSPERVAGALASGACSVVCVKPSRLGGLGAALTVIDHCVASGVPLWMGGMFESGYARGVNTTLGAVDGMAWPGDLSPPLTYLEADLVPELPVARRGLLDALVATPPDGPGMGPPPDPAALARHTTDHRIVEGSAG
jgi:O-succinylbenzoate synthase